jgi:hypothetical protein
MKRPQRKRERETEVLGKEQRKKERSHENGQRLYYTLESIFAGLSNFSVDSFLLTVGDDE